MEYISLGYILRDTAYAVDVSDETIRRWRDRYPDFNKRVVEASNRQWERPEQILLTETEFLNSLKNAPQQMRNYDFVGKDILLRSIFLNLQIDKQNKASFLCKPEFDGLIKSSDVHSGGRPVIMFTPRTTIKPL